MPNPWDIEESHAALQPSLFILTMGGELGQSVLQIEYFKATSYINNHFLLCLLYFVSIE